MVKWTAYLAAVSLVAASATGSLAQTHPSHSASNPPPQSYGPYYGPDVSEGPYAPYESGAQIGNPYWAPSDGAGVGSPPSMGTSNGYVDTPKASNPPQGEYLDGFAKPQ